MVADSQVFKSEGDDFPSHKLKLKAERGNGVNYEEFVIISASLEKH